MVQGYDNVTGCQNTLTYSGTTAHFFRIFPHTVITLVANEVSIITMRDRDDSDLTSAAYHGSIPKGQRGLILACMIPVYVQTPSMSMHSSSHPAIVREEAGYFGCGIQR